MNKKRKDGYTTGIICLLFFALCTYFTVENLSNQPITVVLGIFTSFFGILGFGSLWKPDSIGAVASQILRNLSKSGQEEKTVSHDTSQIQEKSSGIQVLSRDKSEVNITVQSEKQQESKEKKSQEHKTKKLRITREEAESIATDFVNQKKSPEHISISSVIPKDGIWEIKGSYPVKITNGAGSENFTVEICEDRTIRSYKFEGGGFIAFSNIRNRNW